MEPIHGKEAGCIEQLFGVGGDLQVGVTVYAGQDIASRRGGPAHLNSVRFPFRYEIWNLKFNCSNFKWDV
jgi:hypothetical protein